MKQTLIKTTRKILYYRWPFRLLTPHLRPRAAILAYHRVAEPQSDPMELAVTPQQFEQQLQFLRQNYPVLSLDEFVARFAKHDYPDRTVVVTFDDGYLDNSTQAYPIAAECGVPITVFVAAQAVQQALPFWWDELTTLLLTPSHSSLTLNLPLEGKRIFSTATEAERSASLGQIHLILRPLDSMGREPIMEQMRQWAGFGGVWADLGRPMTVAELKEFADLPGLTIGAHTLTHPFLRSLNETEQMTEFARSKALLEEWINRPVSLMAYPYGLPGPVKEKTFRLVASAGYRAALSGYSPRHSIPVTPASPRFAIPRVIIQNQPIVEFERRIKTIFGEIC